MDAKRRILVVDDNELFRDSIVETLRRRGHEVVAASDGRTASAMVGPGEYDCVISDLKMPGMSGIELLEKVKAVDPDLPMLILTAYGDIETAVKAMKLGAFDFIQKDGLINELEMTVERTLKYRNLLRENRQLKNALQKRWRFIGKSAAMDSLHCREPLHGAHHRGIGDRQGTRGPVHPLPKPPQQWSVREA